MVKQDQVGHLRRAREAATYGRRMATSTAAPPIDEERLNALLGQAVVEFGATVNAALVVIGDRLGLYRELAASGPLSSTELATRTGTSERYVREWLGAQAASGWVDYDADGDRYSMSIEQALMFAQPDSPAFVAGGFQLALGSADAREHIAESFVTGTASAGASTSTTCSPAASASSSRATGPTSSSRGSRRSRASRSG